MIQNKLFVVAGDLIREKTEADSSGRLLGNDCRRKNESAQMRAIGHSDMLSQQKKTA